MALAGEVVDFRWTHFRKNTAQRGSIGEIAVMKKERLAVESFIPAQMLDSGTQEIARAPDDTMNGVSFFQKQFRQIGTVLTGDAGNQRGFFVLVHDLGMPGTPFNEAVRFHKTERDSPKSLKERRPPDRRVFEKGGLESAPPWFTSEA
jgi:hypothetical protein